MSKEKHEIKESKVTKHEAKLTLENGVTVSLYSNDGYVHLSFSRTEPKITCTPNSALGIKKPLLEDYDPKHQLDCANSVNVFYSVRE